MKHLFTTKVKVVLVIAVLLTAGLAILSNLTGMSIGDILVQEVLTPLKSAASKLTDQAEQIYSYIFEYETLAAENEALKQSIAELEAAARDADTLARENERLRQLLELRTENPDYVLVDGYIISRDPVDWNNAFTVNRGTDSGVQVGMCAITSNGEVVGLVSEAGSNYAVIKTVLDSSLQISATIASSGYSGMVCGGYSTGLEDMLRMDYLPSTSVIRNSDQVVTSGSTVYPRGLVLGRVVDAAYTETGVAKYAILEPAVDISSMEQVFILTEFDAG